MEKVAVSIIGAGVVGLAIAKVLSDRHDGDLIVFEKHDGFGQETSSRNSEVIHAGIYYPPNTLKSRLCLEGNPLLYQLCKAAGIKYQNCGKVIISTNEEEKKEIENIYQNCQAIGVPGISLLTEAEVKKLEPNVFALTGIMSATTGIIDSHGLMKYYYQQAQANGTLFAFNHEVTGISKQSGGYIIETSNGEKILAEQVINAAGLGSDQVAGLAGFDVKKLHYNLYPCKGDYFSIPGAKGKIHHLVYPVPHKKGYGLGVHATLDLTGQIRLGPDAHYGENLNYEVDPAKRTEFYHAARTYFPWLKEEMLSPDTSGIRPKLQGPDDGFRDFVIKEESANGYPGFINLIGIESPGLTASMAIAQLVERLVMTRSD
ncbi:hypothetical protein A3K48_02625 [candidate division WOR-1 bacterium RIFOXYA12_FULL_52_29]|uniref:FAD dependent oxidoreductase domain-containing protein n=1 Tax=candidate division WOR-1 bacterium RIFOXYC12_FULL_54_18 TaxID=1802584 RepID=A0A1F4T5P5_UNCSA|nr:MAG: hypothetical protein A3K44_02625 [candidate division WOR-1 bacterium RIFOXYA2_FULL_51_19]OGC17469.1 MAG: hypothetical protein A3K48_02625 [candidate division WOR-1 bacterium RIFOXYA12_FULL_52_29]OGC26327.1 MAG: hypothetical protein A3K32_02620 [candidate division WOR-1 bacterium RIFOXYB2_FULL_45_9]OGC27886.1 MAG: hypothetical protein A3K49_02625 [candidate division WOR-1 bacterium RIFOXYC12_FULL_54_18]OGC29826.1 MAG: hypothetical protein A2346_03710 [candidate division WOR-1 bacterium R